MNTDRHGPIAPAAILLSLRGAQRRGNLIWVAFGVAGLHRDIVALHYGIAGLH